MTSPSATLQLSAYKTQAAYVPPGSTPTTLAFTVEGDSSGDNILDVATSDPGVAVSLLLPSGVEVTNANGASLGFTFSLIPEGTITYDDVQSALSLPGTHSLIQIPGGQPSGTYTVKADASGASGASGMIATYYATTSTVRAAATTNSANYKLGDTVLLSGLLFDGQTPVVGAIVSGSIHAPVSLAGQTSLANYQLTSQQFVNPHLSDYNYTVTLTNTGGAAPQVRATLMGDLPDGVDVLNDTLTFGDVGANSSASSANTITIEHDPALLFDPSILQWIVTTPGAATTIALADSGPNDAASGDGVYTGTFTPALPGTYTAVLSITGTSVAGNAFSRTAVAEFTVTQQALASFSSFTDTQQPGGLTVGATVNVTTAGIYAFSIQLQVGGLAVQQSSSAVLATGLQQVSVTFPNTQMLSLGANGPYERVNALLVMTGTNNNDLISDANSDAGPTASYSLSSFQTSSVSVRRTPPEAISCA